MNNTVNERYPIVEFKTKNATNCASSFFTSKKNWFNKISTEILVPDTCVSTDSSGKSFFEFQAANETSEISIIVIISVTFVMALLITVGWRSKNPYKADWFRFMSIYAAATLTFVFFLQLGPSTPGFTRFVGFAVVIHNFAEMYLLRIIWFGKSSSSFLGIGSVVLYVFLMTTFLAFLPMNGLYLLAMIQGAAMDYLFCLTFPILATRFRKFKWNHCDMVLASVASVIHIASLQPLFFGFMIGNGQVTGITTLGLFPTFFLYTLFAARELGRLGFLGPSYQQFLTYFWATNMLKNVAKPDVDLQVIGSPNQDIRQRDVKAAIDNAEAKGTGTAPESHLPANNLSDAALAEISQFTLTDDFTTAQENLQRAREFAELGAARYFKMSTCEIVTPFIVAVLLSTLNGLLVWFSPCYVMPKCKS